MNTTIRKLKYKDRRRLSDMIEKMIVKMNDDSLKKLLTSSNSDQNENDNDTESSEKEARAVTFGIAIFNSLINLLNDDMSLWFADLCGVEYNTFCEEAPFDIELIIIDQLTSDGGEFRSFLVGASRLYNMIGGLKDKLTTMKGKSDSI